MHLYPWPVGFRKPIDCSPRWSSWTSKCGGRPCFFVSLNKSRNRVNILCRSATASCLWLKRLESERLKNVPQFQAIMLTVQESTGYFTALDLGASALIMF
ncbi:IS66 family insertion sequence element accessory protein TnpB [Pseudomonas sp. SWRI92]|nr:IS66 family insertion sequence element accessory protein TnpB [Pseudomonas sp. SWRI92]